MEYDVGKNFEKIEAILADDAKRIDLLEKAVKYLMAKAEARPVEKPAAKPVAEPTARELQEETEEVGVMQEAFEEPTEEDQTVDEIVQQEHEEQTLKPKKRWGRKPADVGAEEPERIL